MVNTIFRNNNDVEYVIMVGKPRGEKGIAICLADGYTIFGVMSEWIVKDKKGKIIRRSKPTNGNTKQKEK